MPADPVSGGGCCVACHLAWEEQELLPRIRRRAPEIARRIELEHAELRAHKKRAGRWPAAKVKQHGDWEETVLPMVCPELAPLIEKQHHAIDAKLAAGQSAGGGCACGK